jgi:SulP family sulfate permease
VTTATARRFHPKLLTVLREGVTLRTLADDCIAGVIVGIVALPLGIAFGIASGVRPEQGLATAIVAGLLISLLGGSRVQIGGPTGAFIVVVAGVVGQHGYAGLAVATMMAGVLLIAMGLGGLGGAIKFIPYPVTVGFTSGIAVIILTSQIGDLLGLGLEGVPAEFVHRVAAYAAAAGQTDATTLAVSAGSLAILVLWPRVTRRVPAPIVAIVTATVVVWLFGIPVETIGSRFGEVSGALPMPSLPVVALADLPKLFQPALIIALLAAIESLLSAVVADGMTGRRHRSDTELVAQGVANLASPLFGGIPATGAIARTATNVRSGGRTPIAGIVHALTVLVVVIFFARSAELVPMATLAAVLVVVAYHMSEWRTFLRLLKAPKSDIAVLLATFLLTVLVDLTVAIEVGVVLSALLFMRRMADVTEARHVTAQMDDREEDPLDPDAIALRRVPAGVEVFEIDGPFFFGAADQFRNTLAILRTPPRVLVLRLRHVPAIDATAMRVLEDLLDKAVTDGTRLVLSGVQAQPREALARAGLLARIGADNVTGHIDAALARAGEILGDRPPPRATLDGPEGLG